MSQRQITELPTASLPDGTELMLVRQGVIDHKLSLDSLKDYLKAELDVDFLNESQNLSDVDSPSDAFNNVKQAATTTYSGVVELATNTEAVDGIDTTRAVTPSGLSAAIQSNVPVATTTTQGKVELATPVETKNGTDPTRAVTPYGIKAILDDMFVGQVSAFAMGTPPEGWLKCNGQALSRTIYSKLFSKIGTTYGSGDGSTTFNLPDLRGEFVRGFSDGSSVDSGRILGSKQSDDNKAHTHSVYTTQRVTGDDAAGGSRVLTANRNITYSTVTLTGVVAASSGGSEARPRNIALLYCIKY